MPISDAIPSNQKAAFAYGIPLSCVAGFLAGALTELPRDCFSCKTPSAHMGLFFGLAILALSLVFAALLRRGFPSGIAPAFGWRLFPTVLAAALLSQYPGYELGERLAREMPARDSAPFSPIEAEAPARAIAERFAKAGFDEFRCDGSTWFLRIAEIPIAGSARRHIAESPWITIPTPVSTPGCPVDGHDIFSIALDGRPEVNRFEATNTAPYAEDSSMAWEALARPERQRALARIESFDFSSIPKPASSKKAEPATESESPPREPIPPRDRH